MSFSGYPPEGQEAHRAGPRPKAKFLPTRLCAQHDSLILILTPTLVCTGALSSYLFSRWKKQMRFSLATDPQEK